MLWLSDTICSVYIVYALFFQQEYSVFRHFRIKYPQEHTHPPTNFGSAIPLQIIMKAMFQFILSTMYCSYSFYGTFINSVIPTEYCSGLLKPIPAVSIRYRISCGWVTSIFQHFHCNNFNILYFKNFGREKNYKKYRQTEISTP